MIIGLCGKSGCGKSTVAQQIIKLSNDGAVHLDIDKVGHKVLLLSEVKTELIKAFGKCVVKDNNVDRKVLGSLVFNSRDKMDMLTDITWKHMQKEIDSFLDKNKDKIIILDWLLLPITKYFNICDVKVFLDIPYEIRLERVLKRDSITKEAFDLREKASIDFNKEEFDYVFNTNDIRLVRKLVKKL